jgi:hypothetical protein
LIAAFAFFSASAQNNMTVTAQAGERQTFEAFGFGLNGTDILRLPSEENKEILHKMLFDDLDAKILRLWFRDRNWVPEDKFMVDYVPGVISTARQHGVEHLLMGVGFADKTPDISKFTRVAAFIKKLKDDYGITINTTGTQNEPGGEWSSADLAQAINQYRADLDARGLTDVGIISSEAASVNSNTINWVQTIKNDYPEAWNNIVGISTHSYNMAANNEIAALAEGKEYWQTEAGGASEGRPAVTTAARFFKR